MHIYIAVSNAQKGNGCSATQVVPALSNAEDDNGPARKITQFARQAQWIFERPNPLYSSRFLWTMKWIPLAMRAYRAVQNYYAELDFFSFPTESGAGIRRMYADTQGAYIRQVSPAKYHDFLIPKTEVGCKRRVMDSDYLQSLHRDNVELVYQDPIREIVEHGVLTKSGRFVPADAIVAANGFQVQKPLLSLNLFGERGASVAEHVGRQTIINPFAAAANERYSGICSVKGPLRPILVPVFLAFLISSS